MDDIRALKMTGCELRSSRDLDVGQLPQRGCAIAAQIVGHDDRNAGFVGPGQCGNQLEHVELGSGHGSSQGAGIDDDRQPLQGSASSAQRSSERPNHLVLERADRIVVVRVSGAEYPLVLVLDDLALPVARKAPTPVVEHQHVVGQHMAQPAVETALGEVDLLTVSGGEREIEVSDQTPRRCGASTCSARSPSADGGGSAAIAREPRRRPRQSSIPRANEARALRSGTETRLPWLVNAVAVATRLSEYAASRSPSSHPSATTQSEFKTTRSAGAAARESTVDVGRETDVVRAAEVDDLCARGVRLREITHELLRPGIRAGIVADQNPYIARGVCEHAPYAADEVLVPTV